MKKNASEDIFKNVENIRQNKGDFYIRVILPPKEELEENDTGIQNCCICFDKFGDAVLMDCGHGGFYYIFYLNITKY